MEAGLITLNTLPAEKQEEVLRALFDAKKGAGFTAMKTPIGGTDFQSAGPWFTYVLAKYYVRYLEEYKKRGIVIDYLSLFNEPERADTKIKYPEIRYLLREHVGPALGRSGLMTKIMLREAPERLEAYKRYPEVLQDPAARKYIAVLAYHGYDFKHFGEIAKLKAAYPELPLWMDELCYAYEAGYPKSKKLPMYDFDDGDVWGNIIFSDLEAGTSAWLWANLIVATGHNNLAIGKSVQQVSEHFVDGNKLSEGMINRVSAVVQAYDPCLSCSTHANGLLAMNIRLVDGEGNLLDQLHTDQSTSDCEVTLLLCSA